MNVQGTVWNLTKISRKEGTCMEEILKQIEELKRRDESMYHVFSSLSKQIDDLMWYQKS